MASNTWPSSVPGPDDGDLNQGATPSYVDDPAANGMPRRRKTFTRTLRTFSFRNTMTASQKDAFETFIYTTTGGAVENFNWTHPSTAVTYEVRFSEFPQIVHRTATIWTGNIKLEEI